MKSKTENGESNSFLNRLEKLLKIELEKFSSSLRERGKEYVGKVLRIRWNEEGESLEARIKDSNSGLVTVKLHVKKEKEGERGYCLQALGCNCAYSGGKFECYHGAAFLMRLILLCADGVDPFFNPLKLYCEGGGEAVKKVPRWEKLMLEIDFLTEQARKLGHSSFSLHGNLLCWGVALAENGVKELIPYERKIGTSGRWSKGAKLSLLQLFHQGEEWFLPEDRAVIHAIRIQQDSYKSGGVVLTLEPAEGLKALSGHPYVFFDHDPSHQVSIKLRKGGVGLFRSSGGGFLLRSFFQGVDEKRGRTLLRSFPNGTYYLFDEAASLFTLFEITEEFSELFRELWREPVLLPEAALLPALERLEVLSSSLPVEFPEELITNTIEPQRELFLKIDVEADVEVRLQFMVQPFAVARTERSYERSFYPPSGGLRRLFKIQQKKIVATHRDFTDEYSRVADVVERAGLSSFAAEQFSYTIHDTQKALDVLEKLYLIEKERKIKLEWSDQTRRFFLKGTITGKNLKVQVKKGAEWFEVSGEVEIEGERIPLMTILQEVRKGKKYVALGKNGYVKLSGFLKENIDALAVAGVEKQNRFDVGLLSYVALKELLGDVGKAELDEEWQEMSAKLDGMKQLRPEVPKGVKTKLRDYQKEGFQWLVNMSEWGAGVCLADDMGLGKTIQALSLLLYRAKHSCGPALVVAPTSVGFNWVQEAKRFTSGLKVLLYRDADRGDLLEHLRSNTVLVTSYHILQLDREKLSKQEWGTVVLDEAQAVKNSRTKRSQSVRSLNAKWKFALTGTPMENSLSELWSLYRVLNPSLLGTWEHFKRSFVEPIEKGKDEKRRKMLSRMLRPFILRRKKTEVLKELPLRTESEIYVEFTPSEEKMYTALRQEALKELKKTPPSTSLEKKRDTTAVTEENRHFKVLSWLTKLRQFCCDPRILSPDIPIHSSKLELFLDTVTGLLAENHRALVFSQFTSYLSLVREAVEERGISYQYLDGSVKAKDREERVNAFQNGEGEIFLISLKAGGAGLNLTGADYVFHLDPWWNPAVEDQASDRAHRIGQTRPVTIYRMLVKGSIEEKILSLHKEKRDLVFSILEGSGASAKLNFQQMLQLIETSGE